LREPGWQLTGGEDGYSSRRLDAWWLLLRLTVVVSMLTAFRVCRQFLRFWPAVAFTSVGTIGVLAFLVVQSLSSLE
jgi:hypothetical protein